MKATTAIKKLVKQFPKLEASTTSEFYGYQQPHEGIWLKNACYDFDLDAEVYEGNELLTAIEKLGYSVEPYDCETMMAYEN